MDKAQGEYWKRTTIAEWENDVGPGWRPLLHQLHEELAEIAPGYKVRQVKEKFGLLRVYVDPGNRDVWAILRKYEEMSGHVCEDCENPGEIRTSRTWLRTLCDKCEAARMRPRGE